MLASKLNNQFSFRQVVCTRFIVGVFFSYYSVVVAYGQENWLAAATRIIIYKLIFHNTTPIIMQNSLIIIFRFDLSPIVEIAITPIFDLKYQQPSINREITSAANAFFE